MKQVKATKSTSLLTAGIIAATFATTPVLAKDYAEMTPEEVKAAQKKSENIGFGTGAVIGAIVAGPLGAIVTSAVGVLVGNQHSISQQKTSLAAKLVEEQNSYKTALANYQQKLLEAEQAYQQELLALQQTQDKTSQLQAENLLMSLQFSTGSSEIKPHYRDQIDALAKMLAMSPTLNINLSGYTDLQGSEELNQALSLARVNSVKSELINRGIDADRINLNAYGENAPVVANNEHQASFYDRRVVIKLEQSNEFKSNQQTVSNY